MTICISSPHCFPPLTICPLIYYYFSVKLIIKPVRKMIFFCQTHHSITGVWTGRTDTKSNENQWCFFFFCFVFYLIVFIHDSLRHQCPLSHNPSPLCSKSAESLSSSQITWQGKKHYITACDVIPISDIAEVPRGVGDDWQFNDRVSLCDRGGHRQLRKAHNSFGVLSSD